MIFNLSIKDIKFTNFYKRFKIFSLILALLSAVTILFQGLNLGVDFKGGTLIELRTENFQIGISEIRQSFLKMNLGEVSVQKFGNENDYLVKIQQTDLQDTNFVKKINSLSKDKFSST